ncbi:Fanconi anemia group C protein isoform X2 [Cynoglossus semilaevis]|uniref:Fanconi anemia group C protein isoform X2 n=1 Tax=Cynoglossus semilaevis TaxID=244447 RepID=UPI000D62CA11|nr:Fanconi anemia group C protein isoform X2 [Cynoglossus semilaevis]
MSQLKPEIQTQRMTETLQDVKKIQFWLDKAVAWSQNKSPDTLRDISRHLRKLCAYLQQLLIHVNSLSSTTEAMEKLPFMGQLLGRLCWNFHVTANDTSREVLFQCLWALYSEHPSNAVERKANQWIQNVLCHFATEEGDGPQAVMKGLFLPLHEYYLKVLGKSVSLLQEEIVKSCSSLGGINSRCSCDKILATSEACVPLVTCGDAAPLIGALLQRAETCVQAVLSEDFLHALNTAYSSKCLVLEEQSVVSLWCHSLSTLEEAVLSLLESVVTNTATTPQKMLEKVSQSLLPKACAQNCSIFLVVNDIFRSTMKHAEGNENMKSLIQLFSLCFLKEHAQLQTQMYLPLKYFFPQTSQSLLIPMSTLPSEMPQEAWRLHLNWLSSSLQRLTEEEEKGDGGSGSHRGLHKVFEAWFLLVQCSHWVQVALQLLSTNDLRDCSALLWLLTFYHHPTNRGHHRTMQLVRSQKLWKHLHSLFLNLAHPPSVDQLQPLITLLTSPPPQQPPLAPTLILSLLVNFAVFFQSGPTHILQMVVDGSGLLQEVVCVLSSLELRLSEGSCRESDTNRVHIRIKELQKSLDTCVQYGPWSPAVNQTHSLTHTVKSVADNKDPNFPVSV